MYPVMACAEVVFDASTIICALISPLSMRRNKAASVWPVLSNRSTSEAAASPWNVKYSLARKRWMMSRVMSSWLSVTTTILTLLTSVEIAKPNSSNSTIGISSVITIVRLSRMICMASFLTSDWNIAMSVSS